MGVPAAGDPRHAARDPPLGLAALGLLGTLARPPLGGVPRASHAPPAPPPAVAGAGAGQRARPRLSAAGRVVGRRRPDYPAPRTRHREAAMFVEEYLRDLRQERFAPPALARYGARVARRVRDQMDANPSAVRSIWIVALAFFATAFAAAAAM